MCGKSHPAVYELVTLLDPRIRKRGRRMCTQQHRHLIFCILPPYLLGAIARNGSPSQRAAATSTLASDQTFRALRASLAAQIPMAQRRRRVLGLTAAKQRSIFTANNAETLPGSLVRAEGAAATGDVAVDEAYDGPATLDFYSDLFGRDSIDDARSAARLSTVHYGADYDNAFWDGRRWSSVTATAGVQPLHRRRRRDRPRAHPRRHRRPRRAGLPGPAGAPERIDVRRVRVARSSRRALNRPRPPRPTG